MQATLRLSSQSEAAHLGTNTNIYLTQRVVALCSERAGLLKALRTIMFTNLNANSGPPSASRYIKSITNILWPRLSLAMQQAAGLTSSRSTCKAYRSAQKVMSSRQACGIPHGHQEYFCGRVSFSLQHSLYGE